jgi:hypothetical protein
MGRAMTLHRPSRRGPLPLLVAAALGLAVLACGGPGPTPSPTTSAEASPTGGTSPSPSPSEAPASASPGPSLAPSLPTQSETSIGRIWDALPPSFPLPAGAEPTEIREPEEPFSGVFEVSGEPVAVARALQTALEEHGFATAAASGPFEDGSYVIDSTGSGDCRIRSTIRPMGDLTILLVRYGAACPFD